MALYNPKKSNPRWRLGKCTSVLKVKIEDFIIDDVTTVYLKQTQRDWFIDTLEWTTVLLYGSLYGLCIVAGVLKAHALTNVMRAQSDGKNNNGYCYGILPGMTSHVTSSIEKGKIIIVESLTWVGGRRLYGQGRLIGIIRYACSRTHDIT